MNNDMSDIMKNLSNVLDNNAIPDNLKDSLYSMLQNSTGSVPSKNSKANSNDSTSSENPKTNSNDSTSSENPKTNSNDSTSSENSKINFTDSSNLEIPNLDVNTILKMQNIIKGMNSEANSSRSNLLRSLKPYLKPSRQEKVEQYIQLFNIEKVLQLLNNNGKT